MGLDMIRSRRDKPRTEDLLVRMEVDMIARIDDLRRQDPDLPSRQEIIRRILADALFGKDESGETSGPASNT